MKVTLTKHLEDRKLSKIILIGERIIWECG